MVSDEYRDYLNSDVWQRLRSKRLSIDEFRCQKCRSPFGLQVHHLRYPKILGTEDPYTDLITLCKRCHEEIEQQKNDYVSEMEERIRNIRENAERERLEREEMRKKFNETLGLAIRENAHLDLSNIGIGIYDFCNIDVIKSVFGDTFSEYENWFGYISPILEYFRNRRYEIILEKMAEGYNQRQVQQMTRFSYNMVRKVFERPETAKAILRKEKENHD